MRGSQAPCDCGCGRTVNRANGSGVTPNSCRGTSGRPNVETSQPPLPAPRHLQSLSIVGNRGLHRLTDAFDALPEALRTVPH